MALLSSSGLTGTPSSSVVTGPSDYTKPYASDVLNKGAAVLNAPIPVYKGQLAAGTSGLQNQAWQGLSNLTLPKTMTTAGNELLDIGQQAQGLNYNPVGSSFSANQAQAYMNPYLQQSLNPQLEEARRQQQITNLANQAQATKQGAFGGSGSTLMNLEGQRNMATNMANITGQGYNQAYTNAMAQFNADQARKIQEAQYGSDFGLKGLQAATAANQAAGNVGAQEAQYGLQNLQAMSTAGGTQQAQNQAALNAAYNQFLDQRNYPSTLLKGQADLIKNIGGSAASTFGAKPSTLQTMTGSVAGVTDLIKNLRAAGKELPAINSILKSMGINPETLAPTNIIEGGTYDPNAPRDSNWDTPVPGQDPDAYRDWEEYFRSIEEQAGPYDNSGYYGDEPVEP